jgi:hypothetical protein
MFKATIDRISPYMFVNFLCIQGLLGGLDRLIDPRNNAIFFLFVQTFDRKSVKDTVIRRDIEL